MEVEQSVYMCIYLGCDRPRRHEEFGPIRLNGGKYVKSLPVIQLYMYCNQICLETYFGKEEQSLYKS